MTKAIGFNYRYDSDYQERIHLLERTGFTGVFLYSQYAPERYIDLLHRSSLTIESLHLSYKKMSGGKSTDARYVNVLWEDTEDSASYVDALIGEVEFAHSHNIRTVVMHITGGDSPPMANSHGIVNIERVLNACVSHGITLCLENLRRLDYLDYVFAHLRSDNLMFCFDSGHAHCMTKNIATFPWDAYGGKLTYLHLNDNDGQKDQHLIPFHGSIDDWEGVMRQISRQNPDIGLTLEVRSTPEMRALYTEKQYLKLCFESLSRLQSLFGG